MQEPPQKQWTRDTPWRQGHVLPAAAAEALRLINPDEPGATKVVVISHDCDLAIDNLDQEPDVEVIVGRAVAAMNGNWAWGKSTRTLHVPYQQGGTQVVIELRSTEKDTVDKAVLAGFEPDPHLELDPTRLGVLRGWLAARYNRSAFPEKFAAWMSDAKADDKLERVLKGREALISSVNFDLDKGQSLERDEGDPYELDIVLVYVPGADPDAAEVEANKVADEIEKMCEERLDLKRIRLNTCFAVSEDDMPVGRARLLREWKLEHMSNRAATKG